MDSEVSLSLRVKLLSTISKYPPETQKARGIWCLSPNTSYSGTKCLSSFNLPPKAWLVINSDKPENLDGTGNGIGFGEKMLSGKELTWGFLKDSLLGSKVFARPCPKTPRHGFVESREMQTEDELKELFCEALKSDSEAELILMPFLDATYSAIYVPESGILTVGPGHDGATGGDRSITLPVTSKVLPQAFRERAGIDPDSHVYVELVQSKSESKPHMVQARSGLPIPLGITEFIPELVVVETVIEPTKDLLAWEITCAELKDKYGVVAWQPGGALSAHAALHCRANNIPYLTREEKPNIGDVLEPPTCAPKPFDLTEFHVGRQVTESPHPKAQNVGECLRLSIGILRNAIRLEYSNHYSRLIGYATSWIFRASALACLGESRHYKDDDHSYAPKQSRNGSYEANKNYENSDLCAKLADFSYRFMKDNWSSNYGGWKWYSALVQTVKLWNLISAGDHSQALAEANKLLDMAHNGGWLFDKFTDKGSMDAADNNAGEFLAVRFGDLYQLVTVNVPSILVLNLEPRTVRVSQTWDVQVDNNSSYEFSLVVNDVPWKPLPKNNAETMKVLEDTFSNI